MDLQRMATHWLVRRYGLRVAKCYDRACFLAMYVMYVWAAWLTWRTLFAESSDYAAWKIVFAGVLWLCGLALLTRMFLDALKAHKALEDYLVQAKPR